MIRDDGRRDAAKAVPIMEVAHRLAIPGLRRAGVEHIGPCPVCGGRDRFSINPARGLFNCRVCGGGDQLQLVQHVLACDFKGALDYLAGKDDIAPDPAEVARRKAAAAAEEQRQRDYAERKRARAIRDAREIWHAGQPGEGSPAEDYLAGRGIRIPAWPPTLRFLPNHPYVKHWPGRGFVEWFRGPCMIAAIQNPANKVSAVHQTWIDPARPGKKALIIAPDGSRADAKGKAYPAKLVRGSKKGGAIRLTHFGTSGLMIMGEGIETTLSPLSAGIRRDAVYWAGVDLGNMGGVQTGRNSGEPKLDDPDAFVPPEGIGRLVFLQDGDSAAKPTRAKLLSGLRRAAHFRPGLQGWIVQAEDGRDMNDMLNEEPDNEG